MLDLAYKNVIRQRTRTILTVLGIVIGIGAVVGLGSFSEGLNLMVEDELSAFAGKIMVMQAGVETTSLSSVFGGSDITAEQLENVRGASGVERVLPMLWYIGEFNFLSGRLPDYYVIGFDIENIDIFIGKNIEMEEGRMVDPNEPFTCVLGVTAAANTRLGVGDYIEVKDAEFEIVGLAEKTDVEDIDMSAIVRVEDLQDVLETDNYQMLYVLPEDVTQVEVVADNIENEDDSLSATTSTDISRQVNDILGQIRLFTIGVGAVAAFVGGLGVMNTMIMAVIERRKEIGVMKAIGATNWAVVRQILTESSIISLFGGFIGLMLGFLGSFALGAVTGGLVTAVVTPALAIGSLLFAWLLGVAGGLYPALKASRLDPVEALRYE